MACEMISTPKACLVDHQYIILKGIHGHMPWHTWKIVYATILLMQKEINSVILP